MSFEKEIENGERFEFGKNWQSFLSVLTDERIAKAEQSLCDFLKVKDLKGKKFLDIGSGSGLFSLVAKRLGASVHSFDYDAQSVACTKELKSRYFPDDDEWKIEQASVLDRSYIEKIGEFDICYSWGVLHHTDHMWQALHNVQLPVTKNGFLLIGIYNDEGVKSAIWTAIKRTYCSGPAGTALMVMICYPILFIGCFFFDVFHLRNPFARNRIHKEKYRGMSLSHDIKDWLGGFPFQVASPERIESFFNNLGYELRDTIPTEHGFGNNQFLFQKTK